MTSEFVCPPTSSTFRVWSMETECSLKIEPCYIVWPVTWKLLLFKSWAKRTLTKNKKHQNDLISEGIINLWEATGIAFKQFI